MTFSRVGFGPACAGRAVRLGVRFPRVSRQADVRTRRWRRGQGGGRGVAQKVAQVVEVLLVGGRFLALVSGPFPFELGSGHAKSVD